MIRLLRSTCPCGTCGCRPGRHYRAYRGASRWATWKAMVWG